MDLYIFIYLLSNVFLTYIINKFMYLFYKECRVNKYIEFCVYSIYFILISFVFLIFKNPIITVSFNILSIFTFTLLYDYINLKKSIVIAFVIYLILCLVDVSILSITNFNFQFNEYIGILAMIVNSIIYLIISFLTYFKKYSSKKFDIVFNSKHYILFSFILIISINFILVNFIINNNIMLVIILNLSILSLNIFIFKYCDIILTNVYKKVFDKLLKDNINNYKKEIKSFKNSYDFKKYINSNNNIIDDILNSKINSLDDEDNIKLKFDILIEENLNINSNDLLIIIGNLMDNAISGVKSIYQNKDKYIDVKIKYLKGTLIVSIKNSFNENTLVNKKGLFNIKAKFEGYGLGLLSVKEVVEKYNGILEIKFNKNNFETYVLIYDIKV